MYMLILLLSPNPDLTQKSLITPPITFQNFFFETQVPQVELGGQPTKNPGKLALKERKGCLF